MAKPEKDRADQLIEDIGVTALVLLDIGLELKDREQRQKHIQKMLTASEKILDAARDLARNEKIEFSYMGSDLVYANGKKSKKKERGEFIHPDTLKVKEFEEAANNWDYSQFCPGG